MQVPCQHASPPVRATHAFFDLHLERVERVLARHGEGGADRRAAGGRRVCVACRAAAAQAREACPSGRVPGAWPKACGHRPCHTAEDAVPPYAKVCPKAASSWFERVRVRDTGFGLK
eukprot:365252-Chlamydomonas_euryale.AAC.26